MAFRMGYLLIGLFILVVAAIAGYMTYKSMGTGAPEASSSSSLSP